MLTCLPQSICSWDYTVPDTSIGPADITFNFFTEQGTITIGGEVFEITKQGFLSGRWTLERGGAIIAEASKPNAFFRSFDLEVNGLQFTLKAASVFSNAFEITSRTATLGVIQKAHLFTRRASIDCDPEVPELAQLFAFWLVVMIWRRESKNNAAATSST